jgi:hypothetical protein
VEGGYHNLGSGKQLPEGPRAVSKNGDAYNATIVVSGADHFEQHRVFEAWLKKEKLSSLMGLARTLPPCGYPKIAPL